MIVWNKLLFLLLNILVSIAQSWTWIHVAEPYKDREHKGLASWYWHKYQVLPFSQLLFSWNAMRPNTNKSNSYFSFWVQVRDSKTKKWYNWHEMAHWGTNTKGSAIQRSLMSKSKNGTHYMYVRLELPENCFADAFRIKSVAHGSLSLQNLKRIVVNTINLKKFKSEASSQELTRLASIYIKNIPAISQMRVDHPFYEVICSPTSMTMLLSYLLKKPVDPKQIADSVYDNGLKVYGSWLFNIAYAYEYAQGKINFQVERLNSFKVLHKHLMRNIPVIVSVRGPLPGSATPYAQGHLLVVIGYDKQLKKVICHDPAFPDHNKTEVSYELDDFIIAWERSKRLAYIANYKK